MPEVDPEVDDVTVEHEQHVAVVTLRRPPNNYFDAMLIKRLADALLDVADSGCRAVVLAAEGRHFCAGVQFGAGSALADMVDTARGIYREAVRLFHVPIPVVAAVQGAAVGGGLGLACAADFRVAAAATRFQANFAELGFHHGFGLSVTLPRLVGSQRAAEMLYTARKIDGREAVDIGLADRLADTHDPLPKAMTFAENIARSSPLAVRAMKQTLRAGLVEQVAAAIEREIGEQARLWGTDDCAAGIAASRDRTTPIFHGR